MGPLLTVVLVLLASLNVAGGQDNDTTKGSLPSMSGVVKEASATTVTVNLGGNAITFQVNSSTRVISDRVTRKGDLVYRPNRPYSIADYVKTGDRITVRYRQFDDALLAVELRATRK